MAITPKRQAIFAAKRTMILGSSLFPVGAGGSSPTLVIFLTANGHEWTRIPNSGEQRTTHTNSFTQVAVRRSPLAGDSRPATFHHTPVISPASGRAPTPEAFSSVEPDTLNGPTLMLPCVGARLRAIRGLRRSPPPRNIARERAPTPEASKPPQPPPKTARNLFFT